MNILGYEIDISFILPVIWFLLLIIVGWIVAKIIGAIIAGVLKRRPISLDAKLKRWKVDDAIGHASISRIMGKLVFWFVFALFLGQASSVINLGVISTVLIWIVGFIPKVIVAVVIVLATLIIADFISDKVRSTKSKLLDITGIVLKIVMIVFGLTIAADQIGVNLGFAMDIFMTIVQALTWGLAFGAALAVGLSYGLDKSAGRSVLPMTIEKMWKNIK